MRKIFASLFMYCFWINVSTAQTIKCVFAPSDTSKAIIPETVSVTYKDTTLLWKIKYRSTFKKYILPKGERSGKIAISNSNEMVSGKIVGKRNICFRLVFFDSAYQQPIDTIAFNFSTTLLAKEDKAKDISIETDQSYRIKNYIVPSDRCIFSCEYQDVPKGRNMPWEIANSDNFRPKTRW